MARTEIAQWFEVGQLYDKALFDEPIEDIIDELYINFMVPDYSSLGYHATHRRDTHLSKPSSYPTYCKPFIYFKTNNDVLTYLSIRESVGVSTVSGKPGDILKRYLWYQQREDETTETSNYALVADFQISDDNYRLFDWNHPTWGKPFFIDTNIPIFHVADDIDIYDPKIDSFMNGTIDAETLKRTYDKIIDIVNTADRPEEPDGEEFEIHNIGTDGTFSEYNASIGTERYYRFVRGKVLNGKLALYKIDGIDNGILKYGVSLIGTLYGCQYSVDGITWNDTDTFPFEYFYRERTKELGTFKFALTNSVTRTPIFKDRDDADKYQRNEKDKTDAENWKDISRYDPDIVNKTGDSDDTTIFGQVYTRSFFSQQYICDASAIIDISNGLFDVSSGGIFEKIKKGVEMYGNNPMDSVQSLTFYPMDLTSVFTNNISQNYIYFGGYKYDLSQGTARKIVYPNGYKDLGTFNLKPSFNNSYRDYEPYTKLRVYLPYIGWRNLDLKRYLNKSVTVRYYIDTRTNGLCTACLIADNLLVDYFNGQMGVSMPITMTDYTAYANAQMQTLLQGATAISNGIPSAIGSGVQAATSFAMGDKMGGVENIGGGVASVGGGIMDYGKTAYSLSANNINSFNSTSGGSSSMINQYLPQEVLFEFEYQEVDETNNASVLRGYPSNASGRLYEFSGYLQVAEIELECSGATEQEKDEIIAMLHSGIHI